MSLMVYEAVDVKKFGTILQVWAHPDDECFTMGGITAAARQNGQRVVCVTATHGEAGKSSNEKLYPSSKLREIREHELEVALATLGVQEHAWLPYEDGKLRYADDTEAVELIEQIIWDVKPDTIFTFEPLGITGHDDHKQICKWTLAAHEKAGVITAATAVYGAIELENKYKNYGIPFDGQVDYYWNIDRPATVSKNKADVYFELPKELFELKRKALQAQASQTGQMFNDPHTFYYLDKLMASEHFIQLR